MQGQEEAVHDDSMGHGEQEGKGRQQNNLLHIFTLDWCACINSGYGDRGLNHAQHPHSMAIPLRSPCRKLAYRPVDIIAEELQ